MKKDPLVFIKHIRDFIDDINSYTKKSSKDIFLDNKMLQDAVIRKIEIIGEAVKNLPINFKSKYREVPWSDIAGMRDKLIHHYFGVDVDRTWNVVKEDIPKLKQQIEEIIGKENS